MSKKTKKSLLLFIKPFLFSLSQFLFDKDIDDYSYEATCQLLMYSAIAIIKMNTIVNNHWFIIL